MTDTIESLRNQLRIIKVRALLDEHHDDGLPRRGDDRIELGPEAPEWEALQLPWLERFMMVESNTKGPELWISFHDTIADAATYHDSQEYVLDWDIVGAYDLDTGTIFEPETGTTFRPKENT